MLYLIALLYRLELNNKTYKLTIITKEAEAGQPLRVKGQSGLQNNILSQKQTIELRSGRALPLLLSHPRCRALKQCYTRTLTKTDTLPPPTLYYRKTTIVLIFIFFYFIQTIR